MMVDMIPDQLIVAVLNWTYRGGFLPCVANKQAMGFFEVDRTHAVESVHLRC